MVKDHVRGFWEVHPCGAGESWFPEGGRAFFGEVEKLRFSGDEFMSDVVGFDRWSGRDVLEVGCGLGTDFVRFLRTGARGVAIDLTERAIRLTRRRLDLEGLQGAVLIADAEVLPFRSDAFDLVYAWGVFHHTPNPEAAVREALRVCRPGGTVLAMVYHPGRVIGESGPHAVYLSLAFIPQIRRVRVLASRSVSYDWSHFDDYRIDLIGDHAVSSVTSLYTTNQWAADVDIWGTEGVLHLDLESMSLLSRRRPVLGRSAVAISGLRKGMAAWMDTVRTAAAVLSGQYQDTRQALIRRFVNSILADTASPVSPEEGREAVRVMELITVRFASKQVRRHLRE